MRQRDFARRKRVRVHREAVILGGNFHLVALKVQHRVVAAVMPELELISLSSKRQADNLVAEANSEDGHTAGEFPHGLGRVIERLGISRSIGEKDAVGFE